MAGHRPNNCPPLPADTPAGRRQKTHTYVPTDRRYANFWHAFPQVIRSEMAVMTPEEHARYSLDNIPNGTVFAYNEDDSKTPGRLKVRWKIRVVSGPDAARLDARQAEAIRELLLWAHRYQSRH